MRVTPLGHYHEQDKTAGVSARGALTTCGLPVLSAGLPDRSEPVPGPGLPSVHSTPHPESAQRPVQSRWQPGFLVQDILLAGHICPSLWSSFFVGMIQGVLENPHQPEDRDFPTGLLFTLSQATASSWDPLLRSAPG